jgi:hypothetical protein
MIWKTKVLVIDYPLSKEKELEKLLKPLAPKINTDFGEIWEPYNGLRSEADAVLDHLDNVRATNTAKEALLALIADCEHYGDDDPDGDVMLSRGYKHSAEVIKKIVEKM